MGVAWQWLDTNPNRSGGCLCFPENNPEQPKDGGWVNPAREFNDLGYQSPHVFKCCGCPHFPEDVHTVDTVDSTAEELPTVTIVPAKRKADA